jgi:hypothetical protein
MSTDKISFVDYDYDNLVSELQQLLAAQDAWKDMYKSSTGQMLLELFAAVGNLVLYYIERRAEEGYIATAQNYSSIVNLARLLNYIPSRNVSSTGTLTFTLDTAHTSLVLIPKWTSVSSSSYSFVTTSDAVILVGSTTIDVTGIQGVLTTVSYISNGSTSQEYNIDSTQVEDTNVYVYVDNVLWTQVSSFISSTNISTEYVLRPELDGTITIVFGNGVFGQSPSLGSSVVVKYVKSDGTSSNVYSTGLITTINSTIYDSTGATVNDINVTNSTTFLGGDDAETSEEIRANAPSVFATGDRAVTKSDFEALIHAYSGVGDCIVYGENDLTPPNYAMYNQVRITVILDDWILPSTTFENNLSTYLYEKSLITVRYSYVDPTIIYVVPCLTIKLVSSASITLVQNLVETAIQNQFVLGTTTTLGQSVYLSDIISVIEDISGVNHCHATLKLQQDLDQGYSSLYTYAATTNLLSVLTETIELWIDDTKIAIDDGAGNWTDLSSTYTITGGANYTTGLVGANISPAPVAGSSIYIRYQQDNSGESTDSAGDLLLSQSQICRLEETVYDYIGY